MFNHAEAIATLCIDKFKSMKKTGKPGETEWTVLAGVILKDADEKLILVSMATGTKCLGATELLNSSLYDIGDRLSDSHAEILARRAFLRYLYDQIDILLCTGNSEVFVIDTNQRIEIKPGVSFHFYCSQTPCGDCSIIPMSENETRDTSTARKKRKRDYNCIGENISVVSKSYRAMTDIHRTGAKCLATESKQDAGLPGIDYHVTGALRTKPGRGDPTLSLSCSDKIAKWNAVGIQGSFLSLFIPILRLKTIVIGGECPFSREALERGLYKRFGIDNGPSIFQATVSFSQRKSSLRAYPCPSSIVWCAVRNRDTEIAVEGRKQGATKNKKGCSLLVSKRELFRTLLKTVDRYPPLKSLPKHPKKINYYHCKQWCISYTKRWNELKTTSFSTWPDKPMKLQNFAL